ncbi:MAG TPA: helix-turn-helix transcriptional regulator [Longimicrobiales bacterium]|nr:helix-turn-helix transcriptional regulator [Longimicrobiales bacterium]
MLSHQDDNPGTRVAVIVLLTVALLVSIDLLLDDKSGADPRHLFLEGLLMAVSVGGAAWLWRGLREARMEAATLAHDVAQARAEAVRWRDEARDVLQGLGVSIGRQFARWELTPAEREVALLLLKGLSHREVAAVRKVSERTARQQAQEVYRKAGLANRSELSAFFLEDLLVPPDPPPAADARGTP